MKRIILSIATVVLSCTLSAQTDTLKTVVNVSNDYNPVHIKVNKKSLTPTLRKKSGSPAPEYTFSKEAHPYGSFISERDTRETMPGQDKQYNGYLRAGYGIVNELDAKAAYSIDLTERDNLRAFASIDGYKRDIKEDGSNWSSHFYNTAALIAYSHTFRGLRMGVSGDFENLVFNYRSIDRTPGLLSNQNSKAYGARLTGESIGSGKFQYRFGAAFTHNSRKFSSGVEEAIFENRINAEAHAEYALGEKDVNGLGIDLRFDAFMYNKTLHRAAHAFKNYYSIDVDPFIDLKFGKWDLRLGTRMNIVTANAPFFAIAPDISLVNSTIKGVTLYAKASGGRTDNSFSTIEKITPYCGFDKNTSLQLKPTYKVVDATIGATITAEPFTISTSVGYAYTKDDLLQTVEYLGSDVIPTLVYANLTQANTHDLNVVARIGYDYGGWLRLSGDARYDLWRCGNSDLLSMKPEVSSNINAEVRVLRTLTFNIGYNFALYTKNEAGKRLSDKHNLSARISYQITKRFGAYLQGDNLIGDRYHEYAGYETRGARGIVGLTANF